MATKIERELLAKAKALGIEKLRIVSGGKHSKLKGRFGDRLVFYPIPKTPSDHRSLKNWLSELKRHLGISCQGHKGTCKNKTGHKKTGITRRRRSTFALKSAPTSGPRPRLADDPWAVLAGFGEVLDEA